jgi:hypothetical protein
MVDASQNLGCGLTVRHAAAASIPSRLYVRYHSRSLPGKLYIRPDQSTLTEFVVEDVDRRLEVKDVTRELTIPSTRRKMKVL